MGESDLPENKLKDFIQQKNKAKWKCDNNHNIKYFTEDEIRGMTRNYNTKIGSGAFGDVYRGYLTDGHSIAVKRNIRVNTKEEFAKEVIAHSQINHKNVVRLLGCCIEENAQMMVFEHVSKGNLSDHLHCADAVIPLETRLNIAVECAEALSCMHSMYRPVLHGDIKPSNILLDDDFHAKVSDFGLARLLTEGGDTDRTLNVTGSIGYMDPTFIKEGRLTPKIDVYSFGVVLVELMTKIKPTDKTKNIVERFVRFSAKQKTIRELYDPDITDSGSMKILEGIGKIAKICLQEKVDERPEMNVVAGRLRELRATVEEVNEKAQRKWEQRDIDNIAARHMIRNLGIFSRFTPYSRKNSVLEYFSADGRRKFDYREIRKATNNFDEKMKLGQSGYGVVYRGVVVGDHTSPGGPGSTVEVAVKKFFRASAQGQNDLIDVLSTINRFRHRNLVQLVGWSHNKGEVLVVYEFMPNGSLDQHLFGRGAHEHLPVLRWASRYAIVCDVAAGLHYMHHECTRMVLHRDIKASSVLLDKSFRARLGNFDLARVIENDKTSYMEEAGGGVLGTIGYIAPECFHTDETTRESDVYAFGAVVLGVVCGRHPRCDVDGFPLLVDWVWRLHRDGRALDAVDPRLQGDFDRDQADRLVLLGLACSHPTAAERPKTLAIQQILLGSVPPPVVPPFKPSFVWPPEGDTQFDLSDTEDDDERHGEWHVGSSNRNK